MSYDIYFTGPHSGSPAPAWGFFSYDLSGQQFTAFQLFWNGTLFDLTLSANSAARYNPPYAGCDPGVPGGPQLGFILMTQSSTGCASPPSYQFDIGNFTDNVINVSFFEVESASYIASLSEGRCCFSNPPAHFSSSWTLSPEPGTWSLFLLSAVGLAGFKLHRVGVPWRRSRHLRSSAAHEPTIPSAARNRTGA